MGVFTGESGHDLCGISSAYADKVQKRLAGFDVFVKLIEARADPCRILQERFGAKPSEKNVCGE